MGVLGGVDVEVEGESESLTLTRRGRSGRLRGAGSVFFGGGRGGLYVRGQDASSSDAHSLDVPQPAFVGVHLNAGA